MQISPEQGAFTTLLTRIHGARDVVEIGTFTGYSSICFARGLPEDGTLLALDINEEWTSVARRYWERAGVAERITLRIGPALESLRELPAEPRFDIAFIDADKEGYVDYWEELLPGSAPAVCSWPTTPSPTDGWSTRTTPPHRYRVFATSTASWCPTSA